MYAWIWRHLPGPLAIRVVIAFLLVAAVAFFLLHFVFPAVDHLLDDATVAH
ncbi:hypothetical protein ACQP04_29545 [Pseudonocardia halophobica]|uniref:hypothetical protein n=1 Tax=Pseudonocardia halophobica TaxID=29401 RepID=UPI003D943497